MSLDDLRSEIDAADAEIVRLLGRRAQIVQRIREEKQTSDTPVYDPSREAALLNRIAEIGADPLPKDALKAVFREIIAACRALQALRVAYLGPALTNTYLAALKHFGSTAYLTPARTIEEIFRITERGETHVGLVPIENSLNGVVGETCDCLLETPMQICAETYLPIHHALMARCRMEDIKILYSHPQVFAQTREWVRDNLPSVELVAASSTAAAARQAADEDYAAAVAPSIAAEPYGLGILAEHIEDRPDNRTRFLAIAPRDATPSGRDKTSIVFSASHHSGSLHEALGPLHSNRINMTLIQSRPTRAQLWEYVFFVDFEGHREDAHVQLALTELGKHCSNLKVLGSYPAAE
jgi:chorismate mutase/prephenate dehydratase